MAISFTNDWKNILDKLESVFESEFKGAVPVYKGKDIPKGVNQALQLIPTGSVLLEYNISSETREYSITMRFIFAEVNVKETALDHVLRYVSRISTLIARDNMSMTLSDSSSAFNCRLETEDLNTNEESGVYVTEWAWKCHHLGKVG